MFKTISALSLVTAILAGAAHAAGPEPIVAAPVVAVVPVTPFWEGAYAGVQLGYAYGDFDFDDAIDGDDNGDGIIGGITLGYLWSLNNGWYLGPEFQYDWADVEVSNDGDSASFDEIARLKLIAGYEVADRKA